jgi:hypothetical protein
LAKIAVGDIYKFKSGDVVDADTSPSGAALNPIFETIRVALNHTDTRVDGTYTKLEVDDIVGDLEVDLEAQIAAVDAKIPPKPLRLITTKDFNAVQVDAVTSTLTGGGATNAVAVTFPVPFIGPDLPIVFATAGGVDNVNCTTGNTTLTGFTIYANKPNAGALATSLKWEAYGKV